jgi:hypothetical protein
MSGYFGLLKSYIPEDVKLCESPGRAGGLPKCKLNRLSHKGMKIALIPGKCSKSTIKTKKIATAPTGTKSRGRNIGTPIFVITLRVSRYEIDWSTPCHPIRPNRMIAQQVIAKPNMARTLLGRCE